MSSRANHTQIGVYGARGSAIGDQVRPFRSTPRGHAAFWTPSDLADHLLEPPLVTSRGLVDWDGIVVEGRRKLAQELISPQLTHHLLDIVIGPPVFHMYRNLGGTVSEGECAPGSVTIFPAHQDGIARWTRTGDVMHILMSPNLLEQIARPWVAASERIELVPAFSTPDPQIQHIGRAMLAELRQGAPGGRLFGDTLATALAVHLLDRYAANPKTVPDISRKLMGPELRRAREYVHDNLDTELSLRDIGEAAGLSPNYLTALFKQATGYPLHQYVIRQRVERARIMLLRTDLSIGEIAVHCGFYDSSHLNRHFKRVTGVTPRTIRRQT